MERSTCPDPSDKRVAVVTGGNKGIGLEVCRQLASRGVMVILTARDEKKGSEAVGMLHGSGLPDVQFHRLDVSDPTDTARLAEFIKEKFGRLDILINNAGVIGASAEIDRTSIKEVARSGVAVVTGGNKGIGLEVCRQLASRGVKVILTARDEKKGSEAVGMLHGSGLPDVLFHRLDVSDPTETARLAEFIKEKFGRLDILINSAGVIGASAEIDTTSIKEVLVGKNAMERLHWLVQHSTESFEEARECLKINYFGTKYVTEALLPILLSSSDGRLINVSSNYGLLQYFSGEDLKQELNDIDNLTIERLDEMSELFLKDYKSGQLKSHGWPADSEYLAYKVSKALTNGYTRILAKALPKLRINSVHPGYCKTDINFDTGEYTAEDGASCIVAVALLPEGGPTGVFFFRTEEAPFV